MTMAIAEKTALQPAKVLFYDARHGYGKCITHRDGRKVYISFQAMRDAGLVTLTPGAVIEIGLDEFDERRVERVRLPEVKPSPAKKKI
jgi:cold shock CspA family protein